MRNTRQQKNIRKISKEKEVGGYAGNVTGLVLSVHFVIVSPSAEQYLPSLTTRDITQED